MTTLSSIIQLLIPITLALTSNNMPTDFVPKDVDACHIYYSCPSVTWDQINVGAEFHGKDPKFEQLNVCEQSNYCAIYNENVSRYSVKKTVITESQRDKYKQAGSCLWFWAPEFFTCLESKRNWVTVISDRGKKRSFLNLEFLKTLITTSLFANTDWPDENIFVDEFMPDAAAFSGQRLDGTRVYVALLGIKEITNTKEFTKYFNLKIKDHWIKTAYDRISYNNSQTSDKVQKDERMAYMSDGSLIQKLILDKKWGTPVSSSEAFYSFSRDFEYLYTKKK